MVEKSLSLLLTAALTVTLVPAVPGGMKTVKAAPTYAPSVSAYATQDNLMSTFDADGQNDTLGKLYFGKNNSGQPQEWFVLGADNIMYTSIKNTTLFAASQITAPQHYSTAENDSYTWYTYPEEEAPSGKKAVNITHYGASNLRKTLKSIEINPSYFTDNEQALMNTTKIIEEQDRSNKISYYAYEKLYPAASSKAAVAGESHVYLGAESDQPFLISYWTDDPSISNYSNGFWIRTEPIDADGTIGNASVFRATANGTVTKHAKEISGVNPAVNINLENVAFASFVPITSTSKTAYLQKDPSNPTPMLLRLNGNTSTVGEARYQPDSGYIWADKASGLKEAFLVVQGSTLNYDWYYKRSITCPTLVNTSDIIGSLTNAGITGFDISLDNCKIWMEVSTDDGTIYANPATEGLNINTINSVHLTIDEPVANTPLATTCTTNNAAVEVTKIAYTTAGDIPVTDSIAQWGTTYHLAVTVKPKAISGDTVNVFCTFSDLQRSVNADKGCHTLVNADGSLTILYVFPATAKRKVAKVTAPTTPAKFAKTYTAETVLSSNEELPQQVQITFDDDSTEMMNIIWENNNYNAAAGATNTFKWKIDAGAANYGNYNFSAATTNGEVKIANAEKAASDSGNGDTPGNGDAPGNGNGGDAGNKPGDSSDNGSGGTEITPEPPKVNDTLKDEKNQATYVVTQSGSAANSSSGAKEGEVTYFAPVKKDSTHVVIPDTVTIGDIKYKITSISKNAFKNNKKITKVTIGKNVKTIGTSAFSGCSSLKTVIFGKNVTTIGSKAFYNCKKLVNITLNAKLKTIGDKAFYKCISLTKIKIPSNVNQIGKQAFYGCKKLKNITISTKKLTGKNVGSKAFSGINSNATIKVPKAKKSAYKKLLLSKGIGAKVKVK